MPADLRQPVLAMGKLTSINIALRFDVADKTSQKRSVGPVSPEYAIASPSRLDHEAGAVDRVRDRGWP